MGWIHRMDNTPCRTEGCIRTDHKSVEDEVIRQPVGTTWYHKDGTVCPGWDECDTYVHTQQKPALTPPQFEETYPYHEDGSTCTYRDQLQCPLRMHYSEHGLSQLGVKPTKGQGPSCKHGPESYCEVCEPERWARTQQVFGVQPEFLKFEELNAPMPGNLTPEQAEQVLRDGVVGELIDGRVDVYGDPAVVFVRQAQGWSAILGIEVQPWQVALCMLQYKLVRTAVTPDYSDNSDDIEGYRDIFLTLIGDDMVHARDTKEYIAKGGQGARS